MAQQQQVEYDDLDYQPDGVFLLDGTPFTGLGVSRYPDGSRWGEVPFVNGREHGVARSWYRNAQLSGEITYVHGVQHGMKREWFEDGSLKSESLIECGFLMRKEVRNERQQIVDVYERPASDPMYQKIIEMRKAKERAP